MTNKTSNKQGQCGCGSGAMAAQCCLEIIKGSRQAQSAEQLMRSRYMAFVLNEVPYILGSWHSHTRPTEAALKQSQGDQLIWTGLEIVKHEVQQGADRASVEFIASYIRNGEPGQMHERSQFCHENQLWVYVDGEQLETDPCRVKLPGRNDPCYCGSGKKYKKCCGA